jgi:hypothetical protein
MWICGEDLPQAKNRITRDTAKKDKFGLAFPHVHYDDHVNDKWMRNHAFAQGRAIYESLGAEKVYEATPFASGHNMGSCRMSERPRMACATNERTMRSPTCSSPMEVSLAPARRPIRRSRSWRSRSGRQTTSPTRWPSVPSADKWLVASESTSPWLYDWEHAGDPKN